MGVTRYTVGILALLSVVCIWVSSSFLMNVRGFPLMSLLIDITAPQDRCHGLNQQRRGKRARCIPSDAYRRSVDINQEGEKVRKRVCIYSYGRKEEPVGPNPLVAIALFSLVGSRQFLHSCDPQHCSRSLGHSFHKHTRSLLGPCSLAHAVSSHLVWNTAIQADLNLTKR